MVVVQSSKVPLPHPSSLSPPPHPHTTSILFEPSSLSLALTHSDSSISLYNSFSPHSHSLPHPQTLIPSPSSSSTFLLLQQPSSSSSSAAAAVLFIVSSPHRSRILLRLYRLRRDPPSFARVTGVLCCHKDLRFEPSLGVLLDAKHGAAVRLAGSVNYFALYALSSNRVWVFAVKDDDGGDEDDGGGVRLMRCAVIECARPVFSMSVALGFLILGEENGVRVFGLRRLVKGRGGKRKQLRNRGGGLEVVNCNGDLEGKMERHGVAVKQTNVKFKHDDRDGGSCFVALKGNEVKTKSTTKVSMSIKAISIQAVSQRMFLILDSRGDLHLLCLSNSGIGVDITSNVKQLHRIMKVQSLAVLPDLSTSKCHFLCLVCLCILKIQFEDSF
uniref:Uncharacterized protein n=1 Tax=Cajanus cajan TaxID=3821 RepID=A0A151S192_CAJCA|nr:hypothetical protein KK1_029760 [Cajanus cajan]